MKIVDAKGQLCPKPLIMTKRALLEINESESLKVVVDNEIAFKNVVRYLEDNGMTTEHKRTNNIFEIFVNKEGDTFESTNVEEYCEVEPSNTSNFVIAFQNNKMGHGSDELGEILIKGFINTLPDATKTPKSLVFLNAGILLTTKDSPVIDALKKLEDKGVEILVCGTCLDYYNKMNELGVGIVSNMYEIIEKLSNTGKVIYP